MGGPRSERTEPLFEAPFGGADLVHHKASDCAALAYVEDHPNKTERSTSIPRRPGDKLDSMTLPVEALTT